VRASRTSTAQQNPPPTSFKPGTFAQGNVVGEWTEHAAMDKPDACGKLSNELAIRSAANIRHM